MRHSHNELSYVFFVVVMHIYQFAKMRAGLNLSDLIN